jgi:Flp pilus assembly protein TadG
MKSSRQFIPIFAAAALIAATAQAARVDMKDPRRSLGREDDIRVDAQLAQDVVANNAPLTVTYQIQNLTPSPIAIADKVSAVSYDEDSFTITISIGAEVPEETLPHLVVIAPGGKKTLTAGGVFNVPATNVRLGRVPRYAQVRVNLLRDLTAFRDLIAQTARAMPVALPGTMFDTWLDASDTIFCNPIPVRWNAAGGSKDVPTAEQRSPSVGTW